MKSIKPSTAEQRERIAARIARTKPDYSPREIRAELLVRNEVFLKELSEIRPTELKDGRMKLKRAVWARPWEAFCRKWGIASRALGCSAEQIGELDLVNVSPAIIYKKSKTEKIINELIDLPKEIMEDWSGPHWPDQVATYEEKFIYVKIDPWTGLSGLDNPRLRKRIRELRRNIYGIEDRDKRNFSNYLCWWDLNKKDEFGRRSAAQIATIWSSKKLGLFSKDTIKSGISRMQIYIDRLSTSF